MSTSPFPAYIQSSLSDAGKIPRQQSSSFRQEGAAVARPHKGTLPHVRKEVKHTSFLSTQPKIMPPHRTLGNKKQINCNPGLSRALLPVDMISTVR